MLTPSWPLLCALSAVLACATEGTDDASPAQPPEPDGAPQYTQAELASDPTARFVSGQLDCVAPAGDWTVEVYAIPLGDQGRAPETLPAGGPLTLTPVAEDGTFSMLVPPGVRRLFVGRHASGELAWGDAHGRYTEVVNDVVRLVLDCSITPTPAPDGSRMATQGEPVLDEVVFTPSPEAAEALSSSQAWVETVPAAPRVDAWSRAAEEIGSRETVDRIKARYNNQLSEEELRLLLPMLYQLADQPRAADAFVEDVIRARDTEDRPGPSSPLPEVR